MAKESEIRTAAKELLKVTLKRGSGKITEDERVKKSREILSHVKGYFGVEPNQVLSYSTQNFKLLKGEIEAEELQEVIPAPTSNE